MGIFVWVGFQNGYMWRSEINECLKKAHDFERETGEHPAIKFRMEVIWIRIQLVFFMLVMAVIAFYFVYLFCSNEVKEFDKNKGKYNIGDATNADGTTTLVLENQLRDSEVLRGTMRNSIIGKDAIKLDDNEA